MAERRPRVTRRDVPLRSARSQRKVSGFAFEYQLAANAFTWYTGANIFRFNFERIVQDWVSDHQCFTGDDLKASAAIYFSGWVRCRPSGVDDRQHALLARAFGEALQEIAASSDRGQRSSETGSEGVFSLACWLTSSRAGTDNSARLPEKRTPPQRLSVKEAERELDVLLAAVQDPRLYFEREVGRIVHATTNQSAAVKSKAKAVLEGLGEAVARPSTAIDTTDHQADYEPEDAEQEADRLDASLTESRDPDVQAFQKYLDYLHALGKKGFGSYEKNERMAKRVTKLATDHSMRLLFNGQPAVIRCIKPARSLAGSFETRTADKARAHLDSDPAWPHLQVALLKNTQIDA